MLRESYYRCAIAVLAFCPMCLSGCSEYGDGTSASQRGSYAIVLLNRTGETMNDTVVHWGEMRIDLATRSPNHSASMGYYNDPVPASARITWTSPDGTPHDVEAVVNCRDGLPASASEAIITVLPNDAANVEMITAEELQDRDSPNYTFRVGIDGPHYIVATYNATEQQIDDLAVSFGEYQVNGDPETEPLSQDPNKGWRFTHGLPYPITDEVRVTWTTGNGVGHEETVNIAGQLPEDLDDVCIVIVIDDPVEVTTVPWEGEQYWWMNTQP